LKDHDVLINVHACSLSTDCGSEVISTLSKLSRGMTEIAGVNIAGVDSGGVSRCGRPIDEEKTKAILQSN